MAGGPAARAPQLVGPGEPSGLQRGWRVVRARASERLPDDLELQRPRWHPVNYLIHMQSVTDNFSSAKGFSLHDLHHLLITTRSEGEEDPGLGRRP